jgi:hypothetical protein
MSQFEPGTPPIRLFLELDRNDDPHLYDDLLRFRKGTKRVSRLRLLAHDGLRPHVESSGATAPATHGSGSAHARPDPSVAHLTGQAFDVTDNDAP